MVMVMVRPAVVGWMFSKMISRDKNKNITTTGTGLVVQLI